MADREAEAILQDWRPVVHTRISRLLGPGGPPGLIIGLPLTSAQLLDLPRGFIRAKILQAVELAMEEGATVVGLGALTSVVTQAGRWIAERVPVTVTSGSAYTAAIAASGVRRWAPGGLESLRVAIVGAGGSVGQCCAALLAPSCGELLLVGRFRPTLEATAARIRPRRALEIATDLEAVRGGDVVVLATSAPGPLLGARHVRPGATVHDLTQPSNLFPGVEEAARQGRIRLVRTGLARIPGMRLDLAPGLPRDVFYACFAETALLAADPDLRVSDVGPADPLLARRLEAAASGRGIEPFTLPRGPGGRCSLPRGRFDDLPLHSSGVAATSGPREPDVNAVRHGGA